MRLDWSLRKVGPQHGKRVLITGANSGIGYHTALELARRGAHIVMASRDQARGEGALARLRKTIPGALAELLLLDLASLSSVSQAAQIELASGQPLHLLINNAGVMAPPRRLESVDGLELQFATTDTEAAARLWKVCEELSGVCL